MNTETEKPEALVLNLGGTISCGEFVDDEPYDPKRHKGKKIEIRPERGVVRKLIQQHVNGAVTSLFEKISFADAPELKDSAEYRTSDLENIVADVRKRLLKKSMNMILAAGTDSSASLAHAVAEGVPPELLGENRIIITVSNEHVSLSNPATNKHEAIVSLTNALYLLTRSKIRGRIGVCTGHTLHSPRGLQKFSTIGEPLKSRFDPIAVSDMQDVPAWHYSEPHEYQLPRGREHPYILTEGIETSVLSPTSEYENIRNMLQGAIDVFRPKGRKMNGLILQAPGTGNLVQNKTELKYLEDAAQYARGFGVPIVLIADPLQPQREDWHSTDSEQKGYGGNFTILKSTLDEVSDFGETAILDGGLLTRTEAQLLMSAAVARSTKQHGHTDAAIVDYVGKYLRDYQNIMKGA